jgi:RNA polymerase sigma factor (TIGR02999 family)
VGDHDPGWNGKGHFFAAAALAMRRILVEQARRKARLRHGGDKNKVDLELADLDVEKPNDDLIAIDQALAQLESEDPRKGQIVSLRYFAGFSEQEVADALGLSLSTVEREWRYCRRWLYAQLTRNES